MPKFIVRYSDNYSTVVEATDEKEAILKAQEIPAEQWDYDEGVMDAEEEK